MAKARRIQRQKTSIRSVTIDGFKSIREQTIELGRLNVFIGANGSGKTALLEAIGVLSAAASGRVDDFALLHRGVRPGVPRLYKSTFAGEPVARAIKLGASSDADVHYAVTLDNPRDAAASSWRFASEVVRGPQDPMLTRSPHRAKIREDDRMRAFKLDDAYRGMARMVSSLGLSQRGGYQLVDRLSKFAIYTPQTEVLRGTRPDGAPVNPIGLSGGCLAEAVESLLTPGVRFGQIPLDELFTLISWAKNIDVSPPSADILSRSVGTTRYMIRFTDRYMRDGSNLLSAYDASEGALHVLMALTLIFHPETPSFFAIENIDHALHPRLARALVRTIGEHIHAPTRQVLLTAQNPLVLDGLKLNDDSIRLFIVDRTATGHTIVNRVEYTDALAKAQKHNATLSHMWNSGLLGGVPSLW